MQLRTLGLEKSLVGRDNLEQLTLVTRELLLELRAKKRGEVLVQLRDLLLEFAHEMPAPCRDDQPAGYREDRRGEHAGEVERRRSERGDEYPTQPNRKNVHAERAHDGFLYRRHDLARLTLCVEFVE